jgi:hypothetical protein
MNFKPKVVACCVLSLLMSVTLLAQPISAAWGAQPAAKQKKNSAPAPEAQGDKPQLRIGVLPFTDATGTGGSQVGVSLSRMVQAEFTHSTDMMSFALPLRDVHPEDLDAQKAVKIGRAHKVDAVILGTVLEATSSDSSKSAISSLFGQAIGGNVKMMKATVTFQGDLFSVATGRKIDSFRVTGKADQKKIGPTAYTRLGDITNYDYSLNSSALGKALQKAVAELVKKVSADEPRIQTLNRSADSAKAQQ